METFEQHMLGEIKTTNGVTLPRLEYAQSQAVKWSCTVEDVLLAMATCERDESDLPEDWAGNLLEMTEECCADIANSGGSVGFLVQEHAHNGALTVQPAAGNSQDAQMVNAAREVTAANGFQKLDAYFEFGEGFDDLTPKKDAIVTPIQYAEATAFGMAMGEAGAKITAKALRHLHLLNKDIAIEQICADRKRAHSTVYGLLRAELRIPLNHPARKTCNFTTLQIIANTKFTSDEKENDKIRLEGYDEAHERKMDTDEARSWVSMRKEEFGGTKPGRKSPKERIKELEEMLGKILWDYVEGADRDGLDVRSEENVRKAAEMIGQTQKYYPVIAEVEVVQEETA